MVSKFIVLPQYLPCKSKAKLDERLNIQVEALAAGRNSMLSFLVSELKQVSAFETGSAAGAEHNKERVPDDRSRQGRADHPQCEPG